jgi:hypothetical protein
MTLPSVHTHTHPTSSSEPLSSYSLPLHLVLYCALTVYILPPHTTTFGAPLLGVRSYHAIKIIIGKLGLG